MFNGSEMFPTSSSEGSLCFSYILHTTYSAREEVDQVIAFAVYLLSARVLSPSGMAGNLFHPIKLLTVFAIGTIAFGYSV